MNYYVERSVNGRIEWLKIASQGNMWFGAFCLIGNMPDEHRPK